MNNSLILGAWLDKSVIVEFMLKDPSSFWASIQTLVLLTTLLIIIKQLSKQNRSILLGEASKLEDIWNNKVLTYARWKVCKDYISENEVDELTPQEKRIASFFDWAGYLLRKKSVEPKMLWNLLSYQILHYYKMMQTKINNIQKEDSTLFENFSYLNKEMEKMERKWVKLDENIGPDKTIQKLKRFSTNEANSCESAMVIKGLKLREMEHDIGANFLAFSEAPSRIEEQGTRGN